MGLAHMTLVAPLALAALAGSLAPARGGALVDATGWDPQPCSIGAAPSPGPPWYRLDAVLDGDGTLAARRLTVGAGSESARPLDLAPESFASGPVDGVVVAGEDDGSRSRLYLVDASSGCSVAIGDAPDVVRSAVLAPGAGTLYEHRVDRRTRADLGIWRREIGGDVRNVLGGLGPDPVLGPTFTTDLILEDDGRLVVSSCAQAACRIRVLDPQGDRVDLVEGTGPALGVTGRTLVARAACHGEPCPVDAIDLRSGRRERLAADGFAAVLGGLDRSTLVIETFGRQLATVDVLTGRRSGQSSAAGVPIQRGSTASAGAEAVPGELVLAPDGRAGRDALSTIPLPAMAPSADPEVIR